MRSVRSICCRVQVVPYMMNELAGETRHSESQLRRVANRLQQLQHELALVLQRPSARSRSWSRRLKTHSTKRVSRTLLASRGTNASTLEKEMEIQSTYMVEVQRSISAISSLRQCMCHNVFASQVHAMAPFRRIAVVTAIIQNVTMPVHIS